MNIMEPEGFPEWMEDRLREGVRTLVVGGCTTTSCVRVSSQAVQRTFGPRGLHVIVDLSLSGARAANYATLHKQEDDAVLARVYGDAMIGRSAVELAVLQMRAAGVEVVEEFRWHAGNDCGAESLM